MVQHFNDDNFQQSVIEASKAKPVLVDFFASWCGPCMMQGPIVEELAKKISDKAVVGKLDTEEAMNVSMKYGIMSIPTLMVFRNGEPVSQMVGLKSIGVLEEALNAHM